LAVTFITPQRNLVTHIGDRRHSPIWGCWSTK
jgi:hypothetical protein